MEVINVPCVMLDILNSLLQYHGEMLKPRSWLSHASILQSLVCRLCHDDVSRMVKPPNAKPRIAASLYVAIPYLHCQKLPLVSKYHGYFNVKMCHTQRHYANVITTLCMKH